MDSLSHRLIKLTHSLTEPLILSLWSKAYAPTSWNPLLKEPGHYKLKMACECAKRHLRQAKRILSVQKDLCHLFYQSEMELC